MLRGDTKLPFDRIIKQLKFQFEHEENCVGLAANQIGFSKKIIIFEVPDDAQLRKWRPSLQDTMPETVWINPSYQALSPEEKTLEYEGCFSVADLAGEVHRFNRIRYHAFLESGEEVSGVASGFLARVIQHEIDHIEGVLFLDKAEKGSLKDVEEYRKKRNKAME